MAPGGGPPPPPPPPPPGKKGAANPSNYSFICLLVLLLFACLLIVFLLDIPQKPVIKPNIKMKQLNWAKMNYMQVPFINIIFLYSFLV